MNLLHSILSIFGLLSLFFVVLWLLKPRWRQLRTRSWRLAWKMRTPMSGGLRRHFYGWSVGSRFGGVMFTRMAGIRH